MFQSTYAVGLQQNSLMIVKVFLQTLQRWEICYWNAIVVVLSMRPKSSRNQQI